MRESSTSQSRRVFDRLVDGELSTEERRELLRECERQDDGWRNCALAFLEAQVWGQEFQALVGDANQPDKVTVPHRERMISLPGWGWLAIAAGLLMAFTLGSAWQYGITPAPLAPVQQVAVTDPLDMSDLAAERHPNEDVLTMWVRNHQGRTQPVAVPLVEADELDSRLGVEFRSGIPGPIRKQLEEQGYAVNSKRRYAPIWFEPGQPLLLPVEDTQIVPVSRQIY